MPSLPALGLTPPDLVAAMHDRGVALESGAARRVLADVVPRLEKKAREVEARQLMEQAVAARRAGDDALADRLTRERMALLRGVLRK